MFLDALPLKKTQFQHLFLIHETQFLCLNWKRTWLELRTRIEDCIGRELFSSLFFSCSVREGERKGKEEEKLCFLMLVCSICMATMNLLYYPSTKHKLFFLFLKKRLKIVVLWHKLWLLKKDEWYSLITHTYSNQVQSTNGNVPKQKFHVEWWWCWNLKYKDAT